MLTVLVFFFFNDTATTEIYTLSLHDALPILRARAPPGAERLVARPQADAPTLRSEPLSRGGRRAARRRPRHGPYDRHHRRIPGRDRRRFPGDAVARRAGGVRRRVHLQVLTARGHARDPAQGSGARRGGGGAPGARSEER